MHEEQFGYVTLYEMLFLWLEKHQPDKPMYFIFAPLLPEKVYNILDSIGVDTYKSTMFYAIPAEYKDVIEQIENEHGKRAVIYYSETIKERHNKH